MSNFKILVFGEDSNDCQIVAEFARRLLGASAIIKPISRPLVLAPNAHVAKRRKNIDQLAKAVRLAALKGDIDAVLIHRDADDYEPAHIGIAEQIESEYSEAVPFQIIAAVPAWEIESWLLLFPDAIARRRRCWPPVKYPGNIGMLKDSKGHLKRSTRKGGRRCPEYRESDGPEIAQNIVAPIPNLDSLVGRSKSFGRFVAKVQGLLSSPP